MSQPNHQNSSKSICMKKYHGKVPTGNSAFGSQLKFSLSGSARALTAISLGLALFAQTASAVRLYDRFDDGTQWTLAPNSGTASIGSSVLTLTSPSGVNSTPTATAISAQTLTGFRHSILVRNHTPSLNHSAFFFWATSGANQLEIKIDDSIATPSVVVGYSIGGTYHWVATTNYTPGADGIYLAYQESAGITHWQISSDATTWVDVATLSDPILTSSVTFIVQNKGYSTPPSSSSTVVDCFNYKATGTGYLSLEDKTTGWGLYREAFNQGIYMCQSPGGTNCDGHITVNDVDSSQHFTDTTIPLPRANTSGYNFEIISTDQPTTDWYENAYRYQNLPFVDADTWTYTVYFKYTYPEKITQGLEFPINKYTNSTRLQGAVAWYPLRGNNGSNGVWKVWGVDASGKNAWISTSQNQAFTPGQWYEVTFTVGLHDNTIYYTGFKAGPPSSMTSITWTHNYPASATAPATKISAAIQQDDNIEDTTVAGTQKHLYMAEWNIGWQDEKLP